MKIIKITYGILFSMILFTFFILSLVRCTIPQSTLIDNKDLPIECKTLLAVAHLNQKSVDKSSIIPIAQSCKEANRWLRCAPLIKDRTLFAECRALLK